MIVFFLGGLVSLKIYKAGGVYKYGVLNGLVCLIFFTVSYLVKNSQGVLKLSPFVFTELVPFALPATGSNEKNVS